MKASFNTIVIPITDFCTSEDNDSVMKKQVRKGNGRNNVRGRDNGRGTVIYDLELFDQMLNQLDELRQWCESLEHRLWWIEEAIRLSKSGLSIKVPHWYKSWLTGKIDI